MRQLGDTNIFPHITSESILITDSVIAAILSVADFSRVVGATEVLGMTNYFSHYGIHFLPYILMRMSDKLGSVLALSPQFSRILTMTNFTMLFTSNALCELLQYNGTMVGSPDMTDFVVGTGSLALASWLNTHEKKLK